MKRILPLLMALLFPFIANAFTCKSSTTAVNFGSYNIFDQSPLDSSGTVTVSCNNKVGSPAMIIVTITPGSSGLFTQRKMVPASGGTDRLNYNLYLNAARTIIWGDGTGGSFPAANAVDSSKDWIATIYGRVPANQDVASGAFTDTLTVTVNF